MKKDEDKKGSSWRDVAQGRSHKQHPDSDTDNLPEGDIHAYHRPQNPTQVSNTTPEEEKQQLDSLEEKLKQLQEQERNKPAPEKPKVKPLDEELLDDWLRDD